MLYRNTRNGAEFESPCACNGADWIEVKADPAPAESLQTGEKAGKSAEKGAKKKGAKGK